MKNKIFTLFIAILACTSLWAQTASGTCGDNLTWTLQDSVLIISGKGDMTNYYAKAPWYQYTSSINTVVIDDSVTSICKYAFYDCSGLTSITIPGAVTTIGKAAFQYCSGLTSVTIPEAVTSIDDWAFCSCTGLTSVVYNATNCTSVGTRNSRAFYGCPNIMSFTFGDSVQYIPSYLCYGMSQLTSITIPNAVTTIGKAAFQYCSGFNSVVIGNSVTSIGEYTFEGCSGLTSVTIPNSVTSIGEYAFNNCTGITSVMFNATNCTSVGSYNNSRAFIGCPNVTTFTFGDSVRYIPSYLCSEMNLLTSIAIPNSVTSIGSWAFNNCTGLTSITIPKAVTSIGEHSFANCTGLTSVVLNATNCTSSGTSSTTHSFNGCTNIMSFTFGDSVRNIPSYMCSEMSKLTVITIPEAVTSIGKEAFKSCSSLTFITIPEAVTSIGDGAFENSTGITSITIPEAVTSIGEMAFAGCSGLSTVNMMSATPPTIGACAFDANASNRVFRLNGCWYDNYYTTSVRNNWFRYRDALREPIIDININVFSNNPQYGTASIQQKHGHDVRCDSTAVIYAMVNHFRYHFVQWSNGSTDNPCTIHLTGDSTVTAFFERNSYFVSASVNDASLGAVTYPYGNNALYGDTLAIVAQPIAYHHVVNWQGDGIVSTSADKDTVWLSMITDRELLCTIAIDTLTVEVDYDIIRGNVSGEGEFVYGTPCTLEAFAYTGYTFSGWSNGITTNPYIFEVTENTKLTALFDSEYGSGIDEVTSSDVKPQKVWSDGQLYILLPDGARFDATGRRVE